MASKGGNGGGSLTSAERAHLVATLRELRSRGGYPTTLKKLFELTELPTARSRAGVRSNALKRKVTIAAKTTASPEVLLSSLVSLSEDASHLAISDQVLLQLLEGSSSGIGKAHSIAQLGGRLPEKLQRPFKNHWKEAAPRGRLPRGVAAVATSRTLLLFLEANVLRRKQGDSSSSSAPEPGQRVGGGTAVVTPTPLQGAAGSRSEISERILEAFAATDERLGGDNYVPLLELRKALPEVGRTEFDEALADLRRQRRLSLDASDGRHQRIDPEQLAAGILEEGQTLVYAQRRHS